MQATNATETKTRKRRSPAKTAKTTTATKQKLTLYVSVDEAKRLGVHATMLGMDRSSLVERLIQDNLKRFVVSDRAKPDGGVDRPESTAGGSDSGRSGL